MYIDARKIHLIEEVLKVTSEETLVELETVIKKSKKKTKATVTAKPSFRDFVGILSKKEADAMKKTIEEGCEQIHPNDWK
jgi:hypothetical protein